MENTRIGLIALGCLVYLVVAVLGALGLNEAAVRHPDAIVLDLGLPDMNGLEVLRRSRRWTQLPALILSVRGEEADKIAVLDAGADDYLTKPFGGGELLVRMRARLRRATMYSRSLRGLRAGYFLHLPVDRRWLFAS